MFTGSRGEKNQHTKKSRKMVFRKLFDYTTAGFFSACSGTNEKAKSCTHTTHDDSKVALEHAVLFRKKQYCSCQNVFTIFHQLKIDYHVYSFVTLWITWWPNTSCDVWCDMSHTIMATPTVYTCFLNIVPEYAGTCFKHFLDSVGKQTTRLNVHASFAGCIWLLNMLKKNTVKTFWQEQYCIQSKTSHQSFVSYSFYNKQLQRAHI